MNKLLVICGPTASGKTALAFQLAKIFDGEIISADSRQIYKGMTIGTGKDIDKNTRLSSENSIRTVLKNKEYELVPYVIDNSLLWLYDVINPDEDFSVSHYFHLSSLVIQNISSRGKLPIIVGGTGLYIKALLDGIETLDISPDKQLRADLNQKSVEELQQILQSKSPTILQQMNNSDRNNPRRLVRKIEIITSSNPSISTNSTSRFDSLSIGLRAESDQIEKNITKRVLKRVDQGIIKEVQQLLRTGYSWELPAMNTFGYKEWKDYISEPTSQTKQNAISEWIKDEVGYVKKQMVWFSKQRNIEWFNSSDSDLINNVKLKLQTWYNLEN